MKTFFVCPSLDTSNPEVGAVQLSAQTDDEAHLEAAKVAADLGWKS